MKTKIALALAPLALILAGCEHLNNIGPICDTAISSASTIEQIALEFVAAGIEPEKAQALAEKVRRGSDIALTVCNILRQIDYSGNPNGVADLALAS